MERRRGSPPLPLLPRFRRLTVMCKRRRSRGKKSTSTSTKSSTTAKSIPRTDPSLANYGEILVLFETPSGFAIFCLKEYYLNQSNIWAIFGEHFRAQGGVPCLFDETVMEVMWGLKNLMHSLVPQEKLKLTKEDRLPMSQGLKMFLYQYGFDVKPELVSEQVVIAACLLHDAGLIEERHTKQLYWAADKLKDVSGINSEGWDAMKIATALRIMFDPFETMDDDIEIFTEEELSTLESTAHKYEDIIYKDFSLKIYSDLVEMREVKKDALRALNFLLGSSA